MIHDPSCNAMDIFFKLHVKYWGVDIEQGGYDASASIVTATSGSNVDGSKVCSRAVVPSCYLHIDSEPVFRSLDPTGS